MLLSNTAIRRPVFTTMVVLALMVLGLLGFFTLGVDLFPDVDFPAVSVVTFYPGAGPEEVEQLVTKPMEEATSSINGIDEVRSFSRDSVSQIVLMFKYSVDVKDASTQVREKLAAIRGKLPTDIKDPVIARFDPSAAPILTYAVSSKRGPAETRRMTEDDIQPKIESIDGVASVTVAGGLEREIHVFVNRAKMDELGLSLTQLGQMLASDSFDLPGGRVSSSQIELNVRTLGRFRSLAELSSMVVASLADGSQVRLSDVARIEDGYKEVRTAPLLDGKDAVTFEVQKQSGSNTVAVADAVYKRIEELKTLLPGDVEISNVVDTSKYIRHSVDDVTQSIGLGGLAAIFVIFVFMLDWRSTLISGLALPTSIVTTFFAMWLMGFNFNMMTLMALSLAIGLLIDDSVVVRENIYRHMENGEDPITAAQNGTDQIGLAVFATTLTIVAVFVPVAFMGGMVGKMFRQFGLTVAAAVLVSLFISFTLDPMLSARVVKAIKPGHREEQRRHWFYGPIVRAYDALDVYYRELLAWSLQNKKKVSLAATALFLSSLALIPRMGSEFMSNGDQSEFRLAAEAPAGTSFEQMQRITHDIEAAVKKSPYCVRTYSIVAPNEEANKVQLRVYTTAKKDRPGVTMPMIEEQVRKELDKLPSLTYAMSDPQLVEGGAMNMPIYLMVQGENYETLQTLARKVLDAVKTTPGVTDADWGYRPGKPEANIKLDRARTADLGVSVGVVAQTIRLALEGGEVAKYRQGDRDYNIRLQLPPEDRRTTAVLGELTVPVTARRLNGPAAAPRTARLSELGLIEDATGPATIERYNRQRQIVITSGVSGRTQGDVVNDITAKLEKLKSEGQIPAGYRYVFSGQVKNMRETFTNMAMALAVAVIFIYFVLASQFESFVHPFTIMAALPLAIVGALLALFLGGYPINMVAMIGVILLMGLVTKNSILLVDLTSELRAKGLSMVDALLEAGPTRLRPILMTSAAMVLGMLPSALASGDGSEMRVPMALAVIGGVITSTFLTLLVVPIIYTWMDQLTLKGRSGATVNVYADRAKHEHEQEHGRKHDDAPEPVEIPTASAATPTLRREA